MTIESQQSPRFSGRVAFVTGAARGLGREYATRLAREGADVIAVDLGSSISSVGYDLACSADLDETARLVRAHGRRVHAASVDVRDPDALSAVLDAGVRDLGGLDIVVANAGIMGFGTVDDLTPEHWSDVIDVNLTGVWSTCRLAVPHLRERGGGSIVVTGSVAGLHAIRRMPHYVAAKHGVVGLVRSLAVELGPDRIRVNCVHPTQMDTPMLANETAYRSFRPGLEHPTKDDAARVSRGMHVLPVAWVETRDVANAALFLVSDDARYITGTSLPVDAGADLIA